MPAPAKRAAPAKGSRLAANLAVIEAETRPAAKPGAKPARPSRPPSPLQGRQGVEGTMLGTLPEWNLTDLYAGIDDPRGEDATSTAPTSTAGRSRTTSRASSPTLADGRRARPRSRRR